MKRMLLFICSLIIAITILFSVSVYANSPNNGTRFEISYLNINEQVAGIVVDGTKYLFIKDDDKTVIGITDEFNNELARYQYDDKGYVSHVLGFEDGEWVDKTDDSAFIGNINMVRLHSYIFNPDDSLYYIGSRPYDPVRKVFVDGIYDLDKISTFQDFLASKGIKHDNLEPQYTPTYLIQQIYSWRQSLLASGTFGTSVPYSSVWYSNLSDVEILTRLIYGENTYSDRGRERNAIAWVLVNRRDANKSYFGGTVYRSIATKPGQFETITGDTASKTQHARTPDVNSTAWSEATWNACVLLSTSINEHYEELVPKPLGIDSQLYFTSLSYFTGGNGTRSRQGPNYIQYYMGGWKDINCVTVVDQINNSTIYTDVSNINNKEKYNIFFRYVDSI